MFNDLNQNNQPGNQSQPVDDIFAETDKTAEAKNFSGYYNQTPPTLSAVPTDIETLKAGLSANTPPEPTKGKTLKVILIALLAILLISLAYLIYIKFLNGQPEEALVVDSKVSVETPLVVEELNDFINEVEAPIAETVPVSEELTIVTSTPITTTTPPVSNLTDTDGDGLTDEEESVLGTNINLTDSDSDGLSDYDEAKLYNTSASLSDTDGDGLSDYEEIKIYKTDPNKIDSDDDGYQDKAEIDGGYNPLGAGKLSEVN